MIFLSYLTVKQNLNHIYHYVVPITCAKIVENFLIFFGYIHSFNLIYVLARQCTELKEFVESNKIKPYQTGNPTILLAFALR